MSIFIELLRKANPENIDPEYLAMRSFECAQAFAREAEKHEHCDHQH